MIIIDGYNLLFAQKEDVTDLESARNALLELIDKYNSTRNTTIKIIFDVKSSAFVYDSKTRHEKSKIEVIFSQKGTSADDYIIALVKDSKDKSGIKVVSSDRKVADAVKKLGAEAISSSDFLKRLREFLQTTQDDYYFEKEHGISKAEVDYWMKVFGLNKK